jgi:AcrR family transcriptional regulator
MDVFTQVVSELGCTDRSFGLILSSSGLARSDFDQLFGGLEACFLETIDRALERYGPLIEHSYTSADRPLEAIGAALESLLELLDLNRALARLLFVQARSAGPQVQVRHARQQDELATVLARDVCEPGGGVASASLAAKAMVGATFEAIRSCLLPAKAPRLIELHGPLMSTVVAPCCSETFAKARSARL